MPRIDFGMRVLFRFRYPDNSVSSLRGQQAADNRVLSRVHGIARA